MKRFFLIACVLLLTSAWVVAEEAKSSFLVEYSVTGGFVGGTHYALVLTDNESVTGAASSARKREVYLIPKEAIGEFEALLNQRGVGEWKSPPHEQAFDAFDTHFKVVCSKAHCDVVFARMPTQGAEVQKQLADLIKELKAMAEKRGRRLDLK